MPKKEIFKLIQQKAAVRKYQRKAVPQKIIDQIIKAGLWSSSIHGFQPWRYVVVKDSVTRQAISDIIDKKAKVLGSRIDSLLAVSSDAIRQAPVAVLVYSSKTFVDVANKFFKIEKKFINIAELSEIECIAASVQNMVLVAESLGLGSCWITSALFCDQEIGSLLQLEDQLVAIIVFGYPLMKEKRTVRKNIGQNVLTIG